MADQTPATKGSYAPWSMRLVGVVLLVVTLSIAFVTLGNYGNGVVGRTFHSMEESLQPLLSLGHALLFSQEFLGIARR
jgi:hypothetical protein